VILLVAIVAAIALTLRPRRPGSRYQDVASQVSVRRADRVRMVKMDSVQRDEP